MLWLVLLACRGSGGGEGEPGPAGAPLKLHTDDGATIALVHRPGTGRPALLIHGLSSNHRYWDLDDSDSFAEALAARGHDVWLLDLRGHGDAAVGFDGQTQRYGWTIDDYGRHDVPAAVNWIAATTGVSQVDLVGHSMGGMVGAIYAASGGAPQLASLVVLGSPARFTSEDLLHRMGSLALRTGGTGLFWFDSPFLAGFAADLGRRLPLDRYQQLYNPDNIDPLTADRLLRRATSPLSRDEMAHLGRMFRDGRFESADGSVDYAEALGLVTVPTLAIGGAADLVVPAAGVRAFSEAMGGETRFVEAGRAAGMGADYGHLDYAAGVRSREEILPLVDGWLMGRR